jgi:hypothetical protein
LGGNCGLHAEYIITIFGGIGLNAWVIAELVFAACEVIVGVCLCVVVHRRRLISAGAASNYTAASVSGPPQPTFDMVSYQNSSAYQTAAPQGYQVPHRTPPSPQQQQHPYQQQTYQPQQWK